MEFVIADLIMLELTELVHYVLKNHHLMELTVSAFLACFSSIKLVFHVLTILFMMQKFKFVVAKMDFGVIKTFAGDVTDHAKRVTVNEGINA